MKKLSLFPIAAFLLAIALSAFTPQSKLPASTNPRWYYKLGSTTGEGDRTNYEPLVSQDGACETSGTVRCVIEAPEYLETDTPDLTNMDGVISFKP